MENRFILAVTLFIVNGLPALLGDDIPCQPRAGEPGEGKICVCDSSYCDTIERPGKLPSGQYHQYTTSNSTPGFTQTTGSFSTGSVVTDDDVVFTINSSVQFQEILGFGGSFTDTVGIVLNSLPEAAQQKLLESYFGTSGIEYTMGRVPIGGTDYSPRSYTLDDNPDDENLSHFSLTEEDYNLKIPIVQKALALSERGLRLLACTWSAPAWMKTSLVNAHSYIQLKYQQTWALYHIKFLEAYKQNNIEFWSLSGGNEVLLFFFIPQNILNVTTTTAPTQRVWLKKHLKPLLRAHGFPDVKFLTLEDQRMFASYWMERFANDPEAYAELDGISIHWYCDFFFPASLLTDLHNKHPDKMILLTETSINYGFGPEAVMFGSWERAEAYIYDIIENMNNWAQSYLDWNLALDLEGGPSFSLNTDAAVIVNKTSGEFYKQPIFYGLGHFSKFIPPGARRVQVLSNQNQTSNVDRPPRMKMASVKDDDIVLTVPSVVISLATSNPDGSNTVIILNSRNVTAKVRLEDPRVGNITADLAARSVNSFVYWT